MSEIRLNQNILESAKILREEIEKADAVVVGGGSGLSSSAGYHHYHWAPYFLKELGAFESYYGFKSPFDGFYHMFSDYESQWGYYAAYIKSMWDAPTGEPYLHLAELLKKKKTFVMTSNIDMQFYRVFDANQICSFQGDFSYLQCSQPCHDHIYENEELIREMVDHLDEQLRIPTELLPRCRTCGRVMVPWVQDDTFLHGEYWNRQFDAYRKFVTETLEDGQKQLLLLELGVGDMTPSVIRLPFWDLTFKQNNVRYVRINQATEHVPEHIKEKSVNLQTDLRDVLRAAVTIQV